MTDIKILSNDNETNEYNYALELQDLFTNWLKGRKEKNDWIRIVPNLRMYGQKVMDLDILIIAKFDKGISRKLKFYPKQAKDTSNTENNLIEADVYINSLLFAINYRDDNKAYLENHLIMDKEDFILQKNNRKANLNKYLSQLKNSTSNYLKLFLGDDAMPMLTPVIFFKEIEGNSKNKKDKKSASFLRAPLTIDKLMETAAIINAPYLSGKNYYLNGFHSQKIDLDKLEEAVDYFSKVKSSIGDLTKQKLDAITNNNNNPVIDPEVIGRELVIFQGGAGTGKTIKLMQLAQ